LPLFWLLRYVFYQAGSKIAATFKVVERQDPVMYDKKRHRSQNNMTYETYMDLKLI
tara:strand:+ start:146 stop:313 length:168 start_codon:yes stop_codon:yes gene_type:complete